MTHRFAIGTQYLSRGKHPRLCTVSKQLTVTDETGEVIKRYYWSTHEFLGQTVTDHDVKDATISIGIQMLEQSKRLSKLMRPARRSCMNSSAHTLRTAARFDFVVTRVLGYPLTVTHKETGMRVCDVSVAALQASGDMRYAATVALDDKIAQHGEERIARVIRQAVQDKQGLLAE